MYGRSGLPKSLIKEVIEFKRRNPTMSIREIGDSILFENKKGIKVFLSKSSVHKILMNQNKRFTVAEHQNS